jgi:hypothetical protein
MHKNKHRRKIKIVYGYVSNDVGIAIGEVGISGYIAYILTIKEAYTRYDHMGRPKIAAMDSVS